MRAKSSYYREQAQRSRQLAKRARDKDIAAHLLAVAEQYERLAAEADDARS